jgi:hypothetical protein
VARGRFQTQDVLAVFFSSRVQDAFVPCDENEPRCKARPRRQASVTCLVPYRRGKKGLQRVCQAFVLGK